MVSTKFDDSPVVPSKWFPDANFCGGSDDIWQNMLISIMLLSQENKRENF